MPSQANGAVGEEFFLRPFPRRFRDVPLPGGQHARIRNLTEKEKAAYERTFWDVEKQRMKPAARIGLICMCLVGADDRLLFPDYLKVYDQFQDMDGAILNILQDACIDHCGMTGDAIKAMVEDFREPAAAG